MGHPIHKHMHTHITKSNVKAAIRDDKAHMDYLKRDIKDDQKFHVADKDARQTRDEQHITNLAQDVKHDEKKEGLSRHTSEHATEEYMARKDAAIKKASGPGRYASTSDDGGALMRHAMGNEAARLRDEERIQQQRADLMNYNPVVDRSGLDRASCGYTGKKRK